MLKQYKNKAAARRAGIQDNTIIRYIYIYLFQRYTCGNISGALISAASYTGLFYYIRYLISGGNLEKLETVHALILWIHNRYILYINK